MEWYSLLLFARGLGHYPLAACWYVFNVIEWFAMSDALYYEIYAADNVTLKARISGTCLRYIDHCINPCETQVYFIYGVDNQGMYSMPLLLPSNKHGYVD
jgi:hypothetical protein